MISETKSTISSSKETTRMSPANKAYACGMIALKEKRYSDALRDLTSCRKQNSAPTPDIDIACHTLELLLEIRREIGIIETGDRPT